MSAPGDAERPDREHRSAAALGLVRRVEGPGRGPERLLRALVCHGLPERSLRAAALLVAALDREATKS